MEVAILGTGYVGSVTGACLAEKDHSTTLVDIEAWKVDLISRGKAPIEEEGLDSIIEETVRNGTLRATLDLGKAVSRAEVVLLCLPTPPHEDGSANLDFVFGAAKELGSLIRPETVVATRSTIPVGTTRKVGKILSEAAGFEVKVANNPEFLAEGTAVADTRKPSRIIIGTDFPEADQKLRVLYHSFVDESQRILTMDPLSSEMSKLFANGILASDITFSNIVAEICEQVGADFTRVREGAGFDPRIGKFTKAGPGYGGSCFPKDTRSLAAIAKEVSINSMLLDEITEVNSYMQHRIARKVKRAFEGETLVNKTIAVLGLSFKAGTDDIRESPAITLVNDLTNEGARVVAYDPKALEEEVRKKLEGNDLVDFAKNKYAAAEGADALVIMTEWGEFSTLDLNHLAQIMSSKTIIDARHMLKLGSVRGQGFYYDAVGRPLINERQA